MPTRFESASVPRNTLPWPCHGPGAIPCPDIGIGIGSASASASGSASASESDSESGNDPSQSFQAPVRLRPPLLLHAEMTRNDVMRGVMHWHCCSCAVCDGGHCHLQCLFRQCNALHLHSVLRIPIPNQRALPCPDSLPLGRLPAGDTPALWPRAHAPCRHCAINSAQSCVRVAGGRGRWQGEVAGRRWPVDTGSRRMVRHGEEG